MLIRLTHPICVASLAIAGCSTSAGPEGPAGPAGPPGPQGPGAPDAPPPPPGAVYILSNDATANEVFAFDRAADGSLTPRDVYPTGGTGTGGGLGIQGAIAYSSSKAMLFAVNPGDNSISSLAVDNDGSLRLLSKISSGGVLPISITVDGDFVYTVNEGNTGNAANISGFRIDGGGLTALQGSTQPLSAANPAPAQIAFTPDGKFLVVTEKATNKIDTYVITAGVAGAPNVQTSAGTTPFGFAFSAGGQLVVSEAFGGAAGASAATSYTMSGTTGEITAVSRSIPSSQSAACWFTVVGTHAYASNTGSNDLSTYEVAANGSLTLAAGSAATTGGGPLDSAATIAGDFLYVHNAKDASFSPYAIAADGSLNKLADFAGLPQHAAGLVAR